MSAEKYLPSYEEVEQDFPPPPPPYSPRDVKAATLVDQVYRFDNGRQMIIPPDVARVVILSHESKHWTKKPCFSVFAYSLAIFSCLFCGCFFGVMALFFLVLAEKKPAGSNSKCNRTVTYSLLSIVLASLGIILGIGILSTIWLRIHNRSMETCRNGKSTNGTCCSQVSSDCDKRLLGVGPDQCLFCCTSQLCLSSLKKIDGCPTCEEYSDINDWNGCPYCCQPNEFCGMTGKYKNSIGCDECCPVFEHEECIINGMSTDASTGCRSCCPTCEIKSKLKKANGCFKCCSKIEPCGKEGTYFDQDGCQKCCKPYVKTCSFYSAEYQVEICRQCCTNPPLYMCNS